VTEYTPRDLVISFGDLHIYSNHYDQVNEQIKRQPTKLPTLVIQEFNSENKGKGFAGLLNIINSTKARIELEGYKSQGKIQADVAI
jgi:thymidylate synthase